MTPAKTNYYRGYIDAKVEDMGKVRAFEVNEQQKIEYRDELMNMYGITHPNN